MVSHPLQVDRATDDYGVSLEIFEGPLDLLLYLIRKDEVDVYDIPIAQITRQYLAYVDLMQTLDLEQAGDFLVMAATLMKIKSAMLLPAEPGEGEEEPLDPREELVRRLLEFQQFKDVAAWLEERRESTRDLFYRGASFYLEDLEPRQTEAYEDLRPVALFDLLAAFKRALDQAPKTDYHDVAPMEVTTEDRVAFVAEVLARRGQVSFFDLVAGVPRIVVVVTFVAVLEMVKSGQALVRESEPESGFWVYPREDGPLEERLGPASEADADPAPQGS
jgi:segregation and condensation protein A